MKNALLIAAASLLLFSACTAYTCPTYSAKPVEDTDRDLVENRN